MNEYRIKVTLRNNLLLSAIEAAGFSSQSEFARSIGINVGKVNEMVGMRRAPIGIDGEFCYAAKVIMEALGACPSDLWTDDQLYMELERNSAERAIGEEHLKQLNADAMTLPDPQDLYETQEVSKMLDDLVSTLTPREEKALKLRYFAEKSLDDVGEELDVTRERARQIILKAERKMRNPSRTWHLAKGAIIDSTYLTDSWKGEVVKL